MNVAFVALRLWNYAYCNIRSDQNHIHQTMFCHVQVWVQVFGH